MGSMALPTEVDEWRAQGRLIDVDSETLFIVEQGPRDAPAVVVLHGFPGSTFEWRHIIADLAADHRVVAHDFGGFGLSAKPVDGDYSLFTQADRTERVVAAAGVERAVLLAHDVGTTVAAELLHRHRDKVLSFDVAGCVLTNGSIFIDLAQLSDGQQALLALPDEPLAEPLGRDLLRAALAATFPPGQPAPGELDAIVALVEHNGGDLLLPRLIRYIEERRRNQPRWTAGLAEAAVPMAAVWGLLDPIAMPAMVDRLEQLRTHAGNGLHVARWPDAGHWPCVERPGELATLVRRWSRRWQAD
jgi:pimeloyl-ACP methyl ester carboxylesterase